MTVSCNLMCCGLGEIKNLEHYEDSPATALEAFFSHFYQVPVKDAVWGNTAERFRPPAHVIFTQADNAGNDDCECDDDNCGCHDPAGSYGEDFAAYILKHKLGNLVMTKAAYNHNSGNNVICWVWTPDQEALLKLLRPKEVKK